MRRVVLACLSIAVSAPAVARDMGDGLTPGVLQAFTTAIDRNRPYGSFPTRCISFLGSGNTPARVEANAYAIHGHGCPGKPETPPRIGSLAFDRAARKVLVYDGAAADYVPFAK